MILPDNCPGCDVTWIEEPIPMESRHYYGSSTHFRRQIAIYDLVLDCTVGWKCPDCGFYLPRDPDEVARVAEVPPSKRES